MKLEKKTNRYIRQIMLSEFGEDGQERLFKAKVLVVGAGGLGSAAITYLAAAGVGELGIVDGDIVEEHNLQRQTIHAGKVGMNKAESAKIFVEELNPDVEVVAYPFNITPDNVMELVKEYDVVVLCPDNLATRYLVNDACMLTGTPFVHSAIGDFEGEVMTVTQTPCYRCVFPEAPEQINHEVGVMGFTAGFFGCIQAAETIKLIAGLRTLAGKYLRVNLLSMEFITVDLKRNPECPVCSGKLKRIYPENYDKSCRVVKFE